MSTSVYCEWVMITTSADGDSESIVDTATIKYNGDYVRYWEITNFRSYKAERNSNFLSIKTLTEFNCRDEQYRTLSITGYAGKGGEGQIQGSSDDVGQWRTATPNSNGRKVMNYLCENNIARTRVVSAFTQNIPG